MSAGTGRLYRLGMISAVWQVPRSTVYAVRERAGTPEPVVPAKRGPKTPLSDAELAEKIREHRLLAPVRQGHARGDRSHGGRIGTERPNARWGTDGTRFYTKQDGWCWFFAAVDHCSADVVGWHVAQKGDRWAALEPIRQGVVAHVGPYAKGVALGLALRHDWGPQYTAHQFQGELTWLGIRSTPRTWANRSATGWRSGSCEP